jgi:hypothetical protein
MSKFENCSSDFFCACEKQGVPSTRFVLIVSVANQTVSLFGKTSLRSGGRQTAAFSGSLPRAGTGISIRQKIPLFHLPFRGRLISLAI